MNPKMTAADAARFLNISLPGLHKRLRSRKLDFEKSHNRIWFGHETSRQLFDLNFKPQTIAFQIVKGGTGKTSVAFSTAVRASLYGARVLCVDLDQQANLTQAFGKNPEQHAGMIDVLNNKIGFEKAILPVLPGLDLFPSSIENALLDNVIMVNGLPLDRIYKERWSTVREKRGYDLIIVDCPPALGASVAATALAVDSIVAPVTPEKFCLSGLKVTTLEISKTLSSYGKKVRTRIVLNKYDNRTVLSHQVLSALVKHATYADMIMGSYIRSNQEFPNAIARGDSVFDTLRESSAKDDVDLLTQEFLSISSARIGEATHLGSLDGSAAVLQ